MTSLNRQPGRVTEISIGLHIGITKALLATTVASWLALGDRLELPLWVVALRVWDSVTNGEVDGFDVNVVLEDDDPLVSGRVRG